MNLTSSVFFGFFFLICFSVDAKSKASIHGTCGYSFIITVDATVVLMMLHLFEKEKKTRLVKERFTFREINI